MALPALRLVSTALHSSLNVEFVFPVFFCVVPHAALQFADQVSFSFLRVLHIKRVYCVARALVVATRHRAVLTWIQLIYEI